MNKNDLQKVLSSIGAVLVMLSVSGCTIKNQINMVFSDKAIEEYDDNQDLKTVSKAYKDTFFSTLPIVTTEDLDIEKIHKYLNTFYVDYDYPSAYVFLNEFIRFMSTVYKDNLTKQNILSFAEYSKSDEYSNSAKFTFYKKGKTYEMNIYEKEYLLDFYESVIEKCSHENNSFTKSYSYSLNKIPGDKNEKKNTANWQISYKLEVLVDDKLYQIEINDISIINEKKEVVNTLENTKTLTINSEGKELTRVNLTNNEFNNYVYWMYKVFLNDFNVSKENNKESVLKLIKNQDN